jgi:hypothetical protein
VITRSVLDTEYLPFSVELLVDGQPYNPTGDVVQFAFMPVPLSVDPGPGDWHNGSWDTVAPGKYNAQVLVGPANGGVALTKGVEYKVWIHIADSPEDIVHMVDVLQIV